MVEKVDMLSKRNTLLFVFLIIPTSLIFLYFGKTDNSEHLHKSESYFNGSQLLHIQYSNIVNNLYKVDIYWLPDFSMPQEPTGSAIINFKNIKNPEDSFNISTNFFSLPRTFFLEQGILNHNGVVDKKKTTGTSIFYTKYIDLEKGSIFKNHRDDAPPFFFEDVDFDEEDELVIVEFAAAQRFRHAYKVYKSFKNGLQPLYDITNQEPYASFDSMTQFDYDKKTVTLNVSGGAADSYQEIYQYQPEKSSDNNNKFYKLDNNLPLEK